ncbi:MAG TPA: hypothetical protein VLK84_10820 [Longimicrobium sp.]|nr:hypothetical protein [Longimicrobium sp.]
MNRSLVVIALLCAAVSGCDSLLDPPAPAARYVLRTEPPVVLETDAARIQILEDRLWLEPDATARRVVTEHLDFPSPGPRDTTVTYDEEYTYETDGSTIELSFVCDPRALCIAGPHLTGQMTSEGMELRWFRDRDVVLSYQRQDR